MRPNRIKYAVCLLLLLINIDVYAEDFPEFPFSKKMDVVFVASEMIVNGMPMRAFQFKTKEDEPHIVEFYQNEWGDEMTDVVFGSWRVLSHRENDYLMTVQIEQGDYALTHGTMGITPTFGYVENSGIKMRKALKSIGAGFPMLSGTKIISDIASNEMGKTSRTVMFSNKKSITRNLDYYIREMKNNGWVMLAPDMFERRRGEIPAFAMNKNGEKFNLSLTRLKGETFGVVVTER